MNSLQAVYKKIIFVTLLGVLPLVGQSQTEQAGTNTYQSQKKQKKTDTHLRVDEIVVTGTRFPNKVKNITSAVGVIDGQEIENSTADYIMDAIATEPSVYVRKDAIYGRQNVSIRGLGSNLRRIQVLVDGRPEKMAFFGCTVSQTLPLANVERIEVLRGPEAVLYGTDAMGGVINIITHRKQKSMYFY